MQKYAFKNLFVLLSLTVFLVTLAGNTFGYAWCKGDDHSRIEQMTPVGCADKEHGCVDVSGAIPATLSTKNLNQESPCVDILLSQGNFVFSKRSAKICKADFAVNFLSASLVLPSQIIVKPLFFAASPRESQTLLAHRTVVLLN